MEFRRYVVEDRLCLIFKPEKLRMPKLGSLKWNWALKQARIKVNQAINQFDPQKLQALHGRTFLFFLHGLFWVFFGGVRTW